MTLLDGLVGQPQAATTLIAATARPVHAYLFVGPPGTGKAQAAIRFAASLLCPAGGDGTCETCRRVLAGVHPDLVEVEREGASISIGAAQQVGRLAARSPVEGTRKVLVLHDFHLVREAGPALLKTVEEPPPSTVFVILAEYVPPELVTVASRCVRVEFRSLPEHLVVELLIADGVAPSLAADLAAAAGGRLDRARLLASDTAFAMRREAWRSVPARLDGTGATVAAIVDELIRQLDQSVGPLQARHAEELAALEARNAKAVEVDGKVGRGARVELAAGVKELEERHRRELRRQRTDELRTGLAILAGVYRERLSDPAQRSQAASAVAALDRLGADLVRNPGETLALQALLVGLSPR
jgi:DNA polymerase-3 subunit delta'